MDVESNKHYIQKLKEGDEKAFRDLYDKYHKPLFGIAFNYLKSNQLAEDAVHDVFVKLWNHREQLDAQKSLKGFLFTSMKNHVLNMIRDHKREIEKNRKYAKRKPTSKNDTEAKLTYENYKKVFEAGLGELTDAKREIFEMKMEDGVTNKGIAKKLEISVNTVKSQYYKASKFIKNYLAERTDLELE